MANIGPTWVLSDPSGSHVGPMNLAISLRQGMLKRIGEVGNSVILASHSDPALHVVDVEDERICHIINTRSATSVREILSAILNDAIWFHKI